MSMNNEHTIIRLFSAQVFRKLLKGERPKIIDEIIAIFHELDSLPKDAKFLDLYKISHRYLLREYRSEYIYKNAIANKVLLGTHSLNTSYMLQEFRVGSSKADVVILNGTSNVYEIKSDFDTFKRLNKQIDSYCNFFDRIHVIISSSNLQKAKRFLNKDIGIIELTREGLKGTMRTHREAKSQKEKVMPCVIFDSLRKSEYISIIKKHFGYQPNVANTQIYSVCRNLFCKLDPSQAHDYAIEALKKRGSGRYLKDFIIQAPYELKALSLLNKFSKMEMLGLNRLLGTPL